ncbi:MAG: carbohydrate binding family 9 domain-containing protein [Gemmatimonadetes bacterium]|nr:carbohydrate binding family 9 domain-containing protein [Gemmatimonadota bacterium]
MPAMTAGLLIPLAGVLLSVGTQTQQMVRVDTVATATRGPEPQASGPRVLEATRAAGARLTIDGRLDEALWAQAPVASDFIQIQPQAGSPATERTEVRVLYDDEALYVGARLYDSAPDSIVARLARRDDDVYSDWFHVGIDSYYDRRTAFVFGVNPRGARQDLILFNDSQDDLSWDAVWDAAAAIDSLGWTAELRIPLSQLRFSHGSDEPRGGRIWGINFKRDIARRGEESLWAPVFPNSPGLVSLFGDLRGLQGLTPPRRLEILPYSVASATRAPAADGDPFYKPTDLAGTLGADVKYGLGSSLTVTSTFNPDFGQVEADPSVVNLTAFETFFGERRPFFVEGSEIFRFSVEPGDQEELLFYSRRIGRSPQGELPDEAEHAEVPEASTILGAAKLSGKTANGWSIGALNALTAPEHARYVDQRGTEHRVQVEPLTNYAVARIMKDFRQGHSGLGAIVTVVHRDLGEDLRSLRSAAYAGGIDVRHRFGGGNYELQGWLLGSHLRGNADAIERVQRAAGHYFQRPDADHLTFDPTRTSLSGYAANLMLSKMGGGHWRWAAGGLARSPGFEVNDLGFQQAADFGAQFAFVGYDEFRAGTLFRRWNVNLNQWNVWSFGGERVEGGGNVNGGFELVNFWGGYAGVGRQLEALSPWALRGGPAIVQPPRTQGWFGLYTDRRRPVSAELNGNVSFEDETGGGQLALRPELTLRPSTRAQLSVHPSVSWNRNPWQYVADREDGIQPRYVFGRLEQTTVSLTTRLNYTLTPNLSLQLYAQPFISAGDYTRFREIRNPRATRFADRFREYGAGELGYDPSGERYQVRRPDGSTAFTFKDPDFNFKQFRSNLVLRWEYRPGSTLFVVWSQGRTAFDRDGSFDFDRDVDRLFGSASANVLLVKLNYWIGS